jgi:phosphatidylinositol glycan class O
VTDPGRILARLQRGAPTAEDVHETGVVGVSLDEVLPIVLLARLAFFASGHKATISSIQWESAFVLTLTVSYPFSPPADHPQHVWSGYARCFRGVTARNLKRRPARNSLYIISARVKGYHRHQRRRQRARDKSQYFGGLLLRSVVRAGFRRRRLMVWKAFGPG